MKKIISIFFLFIFASATTEFGQFVKLPVLIQHFYTHQQKENLSLLEFLSDHYLTDHEDEDMQDDMQLPFKTIINGPAIVANHSVPRYEVKKVSAPATMQHVLLQTSFIPSQLAFQVFHPPRTV